VSAGQWRRRAGTEFAIASGQNREDDKRPHCA
jgi:hypothetical protein